LNYDIFVEPLVDYQIIPAPIALYSDLCFQKRPFGRFSYNKIIPQYTGIKLIRSLDDQYMWVGTAGLWSAKVWKNQPYTSGDAGFGYEILKRASVVLKGHQTYGVMSDIPALEQFINKSIYEMRNQYR
jgi:hypothetical protein